MNSQILNIEAFEESESEESRHLEHFNVSDFMQIQFNSMNERAEAFSHKFQETCIQTGFLMREICGNIGKNTLVRNPRSGKVEPVLMFGSNNYLDLAQEPYIIDKAIAAVKKFGIGCGGPQLLNGNTSLHIELQNKIADIKGAEAVILFSSGYSTNVGWPNALLAKDDWLVYDVQSHGSLYDSMKTSQFNAAPFSHNNPIALEKRLKKIRSTHPDATIIVCVEGVYSMDGDIAPLDQFRAICDDYNALICIDDAHGSGVLGDHGHGSQEHFGLTGKIDLYMGTFSKVYCVTGGYVAGKKHLVDYLRVNARSNLFSASLPPYSVAAVLAAIEFIEQNPQRIKMLHHNARYMAQKLRDAGLHAYTESAIIPIFIPQPHSVKEIVTELHDQGVFINGIEYPSVPRNRQRIRLSMMATFKQDELDYAIDKIVRMARRRGLIP